MRRRIVHNLKFDQETRDQICPFNKNLLDDFIEYLGSIDRSVNTQKAYKSDLTLFFCYNLQHNNNKKFTEITKRDFLKFQNHALNVYQWSTNRLVTMKAAISSLSNYIETILDEDPEFRGYRSIIRKIPNPVNHTVMEKIIFTPEELQKLLDHLVETKRFRQACMLALCMSSGRRKSELPRFKVRYFTDDNLLYGSLWKTPEPIKTKGRGRFGKLLHVYVLKPTFQPYLDLWMQYRKEHNIESEWLFPNMKDYSKPMTTNAMELWVDHFSKVLGKPFYWHSLRHFFSTNLLNHNIPATVVQGIIGWESVDMVNIYNDTKLDDTLSKYFDETGIIQQESL